MGSNNSSQIIPSNKNNRKFIIGIIDLQNDFCRGGKLAVDQAEEALASINRLRYMYDEYLRAFISQDWHDDNHISFAKTHNKEPFTGPIKIDTKMEDGTTITVEQMMWPRHCIENTIGARLHEDLITRKDDIMIKKGTKTNVESYSAFGDEFNGKYEKTKLDDWLQTLSVTDIILTGIASDYCVYNTALDAIRLGYKVHLIRSCTRGVKEDSTNRAFRDLTQKGVIFYRNIDSFHQENRSFILPNPRAARYTKRKFVIHTNNDESKY